MVKPNIPNKNILPFILGPLCTYNLFLSSHCWLTHPGLVELFRIAAVDHVNNPVGRARVLSPKRTNSFLAADVPEEKIHALDAACGASNALAVEADSRDRVRILIELESIKDRRFARIVKAEQHDAQRRSAEDVWEGWATIAHVCNQKGKQRILKMMLGVMNKTESVKENGIFTVQG